MDRSLGVDMAVVVEDRNWVEEEDSHDVAGLPGRIVRERTTWFLRLCNTLMDRLGNADYLLEVPGAGKVAWVFERSGAGAGAGLGCKKDYKFAIMLPISSIDRGLFNGQGEDFLTKEVRMGELLVENRGRDEVKSPSPWTLILRIGLERRTSSLPKPQSSSSAVLEFAIDAIKHFRIRHHVFKMSIIAIRYDPICTSTRIGFQHGCTCLNRCMSARMHLSAPTLFQPPSRWTGVHRSFVEYYTCVVTLPIG